MPAPPAPPPRALCRLEEIADGAARGFPPAAPGWIGLVAVRQADAVRVYVNACPHEGLRLEWKPDRFLTADGQRIQCSAHGAEFAIDTGRCLRGPCAGDQLEAVPAWVADGVLLVPANAGR